MTRRTSQPGDDVFGLAAAGEGSEGPFGDLGVEEQPLLVFVSAQIALGSGSGSRPARRSR